MIQTEIRSRFHKDLVALQDEVFRLGSMVDTAIGQSIHALKFRDINLANEIIANDSTLNNLRFKIEDDCFKLISMQQPIASDLRIIIAVMNIVLDLERMGDHAAGIAKVVIQIGDQPPLKPLVDLPRMAKVCRQMLRESHEAFLTRDNALAEAIMARDDEVDELYQSIFREMVTFMTDDPDTITRGMYLLFVGHNLERIADRVTNICERVIYLNTGRMEEVSNENTNLVAE